MSFLGKIFGSGVRETAEGIGSLAKDLRTAITGVDPEVRGKLELIAARLDEMKSDVIIAEMQSGSWLAQNWRPITMLTFVFIIANNYIIYPYLSLFWGQAPMLDLPPNMWGLLKIGMGGYIVGRSGEQIAKALKGKIS